MSDKKEDSKIKDKSIDAIKQEVKQKPKKQKPKKQKTTMTQKYFKCLKIISIVWLSIGLIMAITFKYKDFLQIPDDIHDTVFKDLKTR